METHTLFGFLPVFLDLVLRVGIAMLCGFAIGLERKMRSKEAGIRTHTIVAIGSCLLMIVSKFGFYDLVSFGDPARIVAQVVSGIGFLGGGIIVYTKGSLHGLTTAAGIWTTAGIGIAIGTGLTVMIILAIVVTVLVIITHLLFLLPLNLFKVKSHYTVVIKFMANNEAIEQIKEILPCGKIEKTSLAKVPTTDEMQGCMVLRTSSNLQEDEWKSKLIELPFIQSIEWTKEEI